MGGSIENLRNGKHICKKLMLFPNFLLYLSQKSIEIQLVYWSFIKNFQNVIKFSINWNFCPNKRIIKAEILIFLKNKLKHSFCNFYKRFFQIFENFPASGVGFLPRTRYDADPLKCPPKPKSWRRRCIQIFSKWVLSQICHESAYPKNCIPI